MPRRYGWCWTISTLTRVGSLYDAFEPADARRIAKRLELHYTPVHGSWLNMAEIEFECLQQPVSQPSYRQ